MGGLGAQDGFDYQLWDALVRIPAWLREPAFEGVTLEGLEDTEARFFAPHSPSGHVLDRFQAKSAQLTRGQVAEVFRQFARFEETHPEVARVHVLVTPALPKELQWVQRHADRVRRARPFYAPFADVLAASDGKLEQDLVREFGEDLGRRVARSFEVELRAFPDRRTAESMFAAELSEAFPDVEVGPRKTAALFGLLVDHLGAMRGGMVTRTGLLGLLRESLGAGLGAEDPLVIHLRSDRNAPRHHAIEIDASAFSGTWGVPPSEDDWRRLLLTPLDRVARWAHGGARHRMRITGSYRISTAFALGWSFRAAAGFELEVQTRGRDWPTDERPALPREEFPLVIEQPVKLHQGRLVVSIGVLRDPVEDMRTHLGITNEAGLLRVYLDQPITSGSEAQAVAQTIKAGVASAVARLAPEAIDLFYAGPTALAVLIGHRWNAFPATHLHEFRAGQGYVPSANLLS